MTEFFYNGDIVKSQAIGSRAEFIGRVTRQFYPDTGPIQYVVRDDDGKDWQREASELTRLGGKTS